MRKEDRLAEARLAIAAANPNLDFEQVEQRAQDFVRNEQDRAAEADLRAAFEQHERDDDARRAAQRDILSSGGTSTGPSSDEILRQLRELQANGEGW